jgi:hypothetical protein
MTERYSSVAQVEVQAALGKVVLLAGYRELMAPRRSGGKVVGNDPSNDPEPLTAALGAS